MEDRKDPHRQHMQDMGKDTKMEHMHHEMKMGGHGGGSASGHMDHHAHMAEDFRRRFWVSLFLTIPVLILSPLIQQFIGLDDRIRFAGDTYLLFALSTVVFFYGGSPFLKGLAEELKNKLPGMMTLIGVAITTAYAYSTAVVFGLRGMPFFWELVTLIDIMLLGHWIEMKSVLGASRALEELGRLMPSEAHKVMPDGSVQDIPVSSLSVGDRVIIKPGEKIPSDGDVTEGESSVNESMLTGESKPVSKRSGTPVIGGSINAEGSMTVQVTKTGEDSFLSQLINLVREAQQSKSRSQDLANRVATWLTLVALSGGAITLIAWLAVFGQSLYFGMERAVTVMVISCPHALGLAVPLVVAVSTALAAQSGLLIRNREAFERARGIQAIIFDKTGTLTEGKFGITDVVLMADDIDRNELLKYAASVESRSEHPIAQAIAASSTDLPTVEDFKAIPGKGAQGIVGKKDVKVVSPGYLRENNISLENRSELDALSSQGKTIVFIMIEGSVKGAVALADIIRPESKEAISRLKSLGIRCMMLTGDNKQVARWVSQEIGLDEYFAEVLPQDKAAKIKEVKARGLVTAMTGDGVNDAPALAQADVGIAIGAGTDVAIETADIILVKSNPLDVVSIIGLAKATYRKMVQNLAWATGYNIIAIPLAAGVLYKVGVLLTPAMGAVLMSLSTVIVAINARFLRA